MSEATATHSALVVVTGTVHEKNRHGECRGDPLYKAGPAYIEIKGMDKNDCVRKLNEFIERCKRG